MTDLVRAEPDRRPARAQRHAPSAGRPAVVSATGNVLSLQRDAGNAAVSRLLAPSVRSVDTPGVEDRVDGAASRFTSHPSGTIHTTVSAMIPRQAQGPATGPPSRVGASTDHDSPDVAAPDSVSAAAVDAALAAQVSAPATAQPGETVTLADMVVPAALAVDEQDSIAAALTYSPSVTQSGSVSPFGATRWNSFTISGITVTPSQGAFAARFTLTNPITFNVASGGKTDVASESAAAITHANFPTVASDLTPNMSSDGGRPPRTRFWAQDLTVRHENFHATERQGFGTTGAQQAQAWLSTQTAASPADVGTLIAQVPGRVIASSQAAAGDVHTKESRAYGDGAALYLARADAIRARGALGANGGYPGAPAPPAAPGGTP